MSTGTLDSSDAIALEAQHMTLNYPRYPIVMTRGEGSRLWDADGGEYLDLFSGFGAGVLGHCHPELVAAVTEQAGKLWHVGNLFHTEPQARLAKAIADHGFGGRSFFCHSGADANEAAIKLARLYGRANPGPAGPRFKVITAHQSFHGRTLGTMVATAQPKVSEGFDPLPAGFSHMPFNDLAAAREAVDDQTVAILVEPIQGEGGVHVPDDDYLPGLRALCDERDLLLMVDEVWTGCGRTGRYFAHQYWDVTPDVMTLAKGVGGGLPVGVMCAGPKAADLYDFKRAGGVKHATTLGGNCLSMAASAAVFGVLERDGLVQRAAAMGRAAMDRLRAFGRSHGVIREVRGKGLFLGVELAPSDATWFATGADVVNRCMNRAAPGAPGVLLNATQGTVLRLAPSLAIADADWDAGLAVLEAVLLGED